MKWLAGREEQADRYFEEIIEIAKDSSGDYTVDRNGEWVVDHENIQRSRLRVDALKWIASKLAPRKYGDRYTVPHSPMLRLLVSKIAPLSYRRLTSSKKRCAALGSN